MTALSGAVYDRGYRPYDGERGGRRASRAALFRASVRRALGFRRSWRQKVLPWTLLAIVSVPAVVNVGVAYLTRDTPAEDIEFITYREYVGVSTALLLFVALTAPDVICPDRRHRVLPLIFSRPLSTTDYVLTKVGAIFSIFFLFGFLPHVVLFVGQTFVSDDGALAYVGDHADVIWKVPVAVALQALYFAVLGVLAASFTVRRVIAGAGLLIVLLVSSSASAILRGTTADGERLDASAWSLVNLLSIPSELRDLVFLGHVDPAGSLSGVHGGGAMAIAVYAGVVAVSAALLFHRYRWVDP